VSSGDSQAGDEKTHRRAGKAQLNYLISDDVRRGIEEVWRDHTQLDGKRCSRPGNYVEDVLRRSLVEKGVLPKSPQRALSKPLTKSKQAAVREG